MSAASQMLGADGLDRRMAPAALIGLYHNHPVS
jgi:hypothetical protein